MVRISTSQGLYEIERDSPDSIAISNNSKDNPRTIWSIDLHKLGNCLVEVMGKIKTGETYLARIERNPDNEIYLRTRKKGENNELVIQRGKIEMVFGDSDVLKLLRTLNRVRIH